MDSPTFGLKCVAATGLRKYYEKSCNFLSLEISIGNNKSTGTYKMPRPTELFTIDAAKVIRWTPLAVCVSIDGEELWFPFSEIREPDELYIHASRGQEIELVVPAWLAKAKGLI